MSHLPYESCPYHGTALPCSICAAEEKEAEAYTAPASASLPDKPAGLAEWLLIAILVVMMGTAIASVAGRFINQVIPPGSSVSWLTLALLGAMASVLGVLSARKSRQRG